MELVMLTMLVGSENQQRLSGAREASDDDAGCAIDGDLADIIEEMQAAGHHDEVAVISERMQRKRKRCEDAAVGAKVKAALDKHAMATKAA